MRKKRIKGEQHSRTNKAVAEKRHGWLAGLSRSGIGHIFESLAAALIELKVQESFKSNLPDAFIL